MFWSLSREFVDNVPPCCNSDTSVTAPPAITTLTSPTHTPQAAAQCLDHDRGTHGILQQGVWSHPYPTPVERRFPPNMKRRLVKTNKKTALPQRFRPATGRTYGVAEQGAPVLLFLRPCFFESSKRVRCHHLCPLVGVVSASPHTCAPTNQQPRRSVH